MTVMVELVSAIVVALILGTATGNLPAIEKGVGKGVGKVRAKARDGATAATARVHAAATSGAGGLGEKLLRGAGVVLAAVRRLTETRLTEASPSTAAPSRTSTLSTSTPAPPVAGEAAALTEPSGPPQPRWHPQHDPAGEAAVDRADPLADRPAAGGAVPRTHVMTVQPVPGRRGYYQAMCVCGVPGATDFYPGAAARFGPAMHERITGIPARLVPTAQAIADRWWATVPDDEDEPAPVTAVNAPVTPSVNASVNAPVNALVKENTVMSIVDITDLDSAPESDAEHLGRLAALARGAEAIATGLAEYEATLAESVGLAAVSYSGLSGASEAMTEAATQLRQAAQAFISAYGPVMETVAAGVQLPYNARFFSGEDAPTTSAA